MLSFLQENVHSIGEHVSGDQIPKGELVMLYISDACMWRIFSILPIVARTYDAWLKYSERRLSELLAEDIQDERSKTTTFVSLHH